MVDSKENYKFDLGVKGLRPFWQKESRVWYHNILCARLSTLGLHRTSLHLPCFDSELTSSKMLKNIRLLIFLANHWSSSVKSTNLHRNAYGAIGYIGSEGASLSLSLNRKPRTRWTGRRVVCLCVIDNCFKNWNISDLTFWGRYATVCTNSFLIREVNERIFFC